MVVAKLPHRLMKWDPDETALPLQKPHSSWPYVDSHLRLILDDLRSEPAMIVGSNPHPVSDTGLAHGTIRIVP